MSEPEDLTPVLMLERVTRSGNGLQSLKSSGRPLRIMQKGKDRDEIVHSAEQNVLTQITIVDAHVHIYDCFELNALLDSAYKNFDIQATTFGNRDAFRGLLLLAETAADSWYKSTVSALQRRQKIENQWDWSLRRLPEDRCALRAQRSTGETIFIVAGHQIVTAEGLEVLALLTENTVTDGTPIADVLRILGETDAIVVIPWAVGKWLGRRGTIVMDLIKPNEYGLMLGDNGGRPAFWRNPAHFVKARASGMKILPGTDPLPFTSEVTRVGSFGFVLDTPVSESRPGEDLKRLIHDTNTGIHPYGELERPVRFLRNQLRLRFR